MVCSKCGFNNEDDAKYCVECGEVLGLHGSESEGNKHQPGRYIERTREKGKKDLGTQTIEPPIKSPELQKKTKSKFNPIFIVIPVGMVFLIIAAVTVFTAFRFVSKKISQGKPTSAEKYSVEETLDETAESPESFMMPTEATTLPETQASGENTDNIPNNENAYQTPGYEEQTDGDLSYMLPESDKRYISAYELQSMSGYELRIARNEIYARHGRRFTDPALDSYFRGKAWYTPTTDGDSFNEDALSQIEKTNLDTIKSVESQKSQGASTTANTDNSSYRFVVCRDLNGNVGSTSTQVTAIKNVSYDSSQLKITQVLNTGEERTGTAAKYYGRLKQKVTASFSAYAEVYSTKVSDGTTMYIDVFDEYGMIRETDSNGNELYYVLPGGVDIEQILRS